MSTIYKWLFQRTHPCCSVQLILRCRSCTSFETNCSQLMYRHLQSEHRKERPEMLNCCCRLCLQSSDTVPAVSEIQEDVNGMYYSSVMDSHSNTTTIGETAPVVTNTMMNISYQCSQCSKTFSSDSELITHKATVHPTGGPLHCQFCDQTFSNRTDLIAHSDIHTGAGDNFFPSKQNFNMHLGMTTLEKECIIISRNCRKLFENNTNLTQHTTTHTGVKVKPYTCEHCNKSFTLKGNLTRHTKIHTYIKPYSCEHCGKSFTQKIHLTKHTKTHISSGKTCYNKCEYCDKTFSLKYDVIRHTRIHTGVKPYTCIFCGKSFTQKIHLNRHDRIHTGVKPYTCEHCHKSFTDKSSLINHIRIHSGVKPYKCDHCFKAFTQKCHLMKHNRMHMCL